MGFHPILEMRTKKFQCATWLSIAHQCAHMRTLLNTLIELLCFVFQWCYKIWGMKFQQKSIYVSILALTGWTIFFIQCINQKSKWNGKSQSENIDFLPIFSEFELLVCFRTIVKTMKNWENAVYVVSAPEICASTISVFIKLDSHRLHQMSYSA